MPRFNPVLVPASEHLASSESGVGMEVLPLTKTPPSSDAAAVPHHKPQLADEVLLKPEPRIRRTVSKLHEMITKAKTGEAAEIMQFVPPTRLKNVRKMLQSPTTSSNTSPTSTISPSDGPLLPTPKVRDKIMCVYERVREKDRMCVNIFFLHRFKSNRHQRISLPRQ